MSDLTDKQASQSVKITGADPSTGIESNYLEVDTSGRPTFKLNDGNGNAITSTTINSKQRLDVTTAASGPVSPGTVADKSQLIGAQYNSTLPTATTGQQLALQVDKNGRIIVSNYSTVAPFQTFNQQSINSGITVYTSAIISSTIGLTQFYAGGTGIGKQALFKYTPSTTQFITDGNFESTGEVANWTISNPSAPDLGTKSYSTTQAYTGTGSVQLIFTKSDNTHNDRLTHTFSPSIDISGWRYITTQFYNTVSSGGAYTRTISITAYDSGGNTRVYSRSGSSTTSPFNSSGWIKITGEIENPTSSTGTGFDPTDIVSIELKMTDSGNKTGTVYWDTVQLESQLVSIFPIYHIANSSFNITIDPVIQLVSGDQIVIVQKNLDTARKEYFAFVGGVVF